MTLAQITGGVGGLLAALGGWALVTPTGFRRATLALPRHKIAAWILTLIALAWAVHEMQALSLGGLDVWKQRAYYAIPVAFYFIVVYLDELLAARALGGVLLILPTPWLDAARWFDSDWTLVPKVTAYLMVVAGMYLVATPYRFRQWLLPCLDNGPRARALAGLLLALGAAHLVLALAVF